MWDGETLLGEDPVDPPAAFVLGVTEPTLENTGPRIAATTTYGSPGNPYTLTISSPGTYAGLEVWGKIRVTAQTGVHIVDTRVHMTGNPTTEQYGIIFENANGYGNTLNFCSVDVPDETERQNEWFSSGVRGRGVDCYRSRVSQTVDGFQPLGNSANATETRTMGIYGCLSFDHFERPSEVHTDTFMTHNDAVQAFGAINLVVVGSALYGGTTSCIILNKTVADHYGYVTIEDNWLYGDPTKGATINVTSTGGVQIPGPVQIHRNRVDPSGYLTGQIRATSPNRVPEWFGATSGTANGANTNDWVYGPNANVYMDTGNPVPIKVG